MRAHRIHVHSRRMQIDAHLAKSLNAVAVKERLRRALFRQRGKAGDVVDRARFVAHMHYRDKHRVGREQARERLFVHRAAESDGSENYLIAAPFEFAGALIDGGMLDGRDDHSAAFTAQRAQKRHIVRFAPRGCKIYLPRVRAQKRGDALARAVHRLLGFERAFIAGGGIKEYLFVIFFQHFSAFFIHFRRCGIVKIYHLLSS